MRRIALLLGATALMLALLVPAFAGAAQNNNKKVTICHYPPGNPANVHTITISKNAVAQHFAQHGDTYPDAKGECPKKNGDDEKVVYAWVKDGNKKPECKKIDKADSSKYNKVYKDSKCKHEKIVYVEKKENGKYKCEPINKAKADKYDRVYKDKKCKEELKKPAH